MQRCFPYLMYLIIPREVSFKHDGARSEPSEAISVEDDYDSSVTRERQVEHFGIFRDF